MSNKPRHISSIAKNHTEALYPWLWKDLVFCAFPSLHIGGDRLVDYSIYKNHAQLYNTEFADWVGSAFWFFTNDYAELPQRNSSPDLDELAVGEKPFTMSVWVRPYDTNQGAMIMGRRKSGGSYSQFAIWQGTITGVGTVNASKDITVTCIGDGGTSTDAYWGHTTNAVIDGDWHHLCLTRDGITNPRLYVDGAEIAFTVVKNTGTIPRSIVSDNTAEWNIAQNNSGQYWYGYQDQIMIWRRALDPSEISQLAKGATPLEMRPSLVQYTYPLFAPVGAPTFTGLGSVTGLGSITWN